MENSPKKVAIVGAGVAGLVAGIYAQKSGFQTEIFEKNPNNGGLCVSWKRDDILIDGCIHWMTGTKEGTTLNDMWHYVRGFEQKDIIYFDTFGTVEYKGEIFYLYTDIEKLEKEMLEVSPKDKRMIKRFIKYLKRIYKMPLPIKKPYKLFHIFDFIKIGFSLLPYLPTYLYTASVSKKTFAKKFKSPLLRYAIERIVPGDTNLYGTLYAYSTAIFGNGGVPRGGSSFLIDNLVKEYTRLGGVIHNNSEVDEFIFDKKKVTGMRLVKGQIIKADYYITACDAAEATRNLIRNKKSDKRLNKRFIKWNEYPTPSCVYISFKIDAEEFKKLNVPATFEFECEPLEVGHKVEDTIKIREYGYDKRFSNGKDELLTVLLHQNDKDFYHWEKLKNDIKLYKQEKQRIAEEVQNRIIKRFPSLEGKIKIIDVVTPMTYQRYVNAHRGAYMAWSYTDMGKQLLDGTTMHKFKNLVFAGQWIVMPGGIPIALMSGKFAVQMLLKKEHKSVKIDERKENRC